MAMSAALDRLVKAKAVLEPAELVGEYRFRLEAIETVSVGIRVWREVGQAQAPYSFQLSHYLKTPMLTGPFRPASPFRDSLQEALDAAIDTLAQHLNHAVRHGHVPQAGWLIPDSNWYR